MHSYVMSPHEGPGDKPWIWDQFVFDLIFGRVLQDLRRLQDEAPNDDRASCIEWLAFVMQPGVYRFGLGEYAPATVAEIRQAVAANRDAILADPELAAHPHRDYATQRVTRAFDDLLVLIDLHLAQAGQRT